MKKTIKNNSFRMLMLWIFMFASVFSVCGQPKLLPQQRQQILNRVQQYCRYLSEFSSDIEYIDRMDSIIFICENDKVQTFNDLSLDKTKSATETSSYPLFQYLQQITTQFDNQVQMSFDNFECEKILSEPTLGLNGETSNFYALVRVRKSIQAGNYRLTTRQKITVNMSSFKIGGTVSEDYEDPHAKYLEAMLYKNEGKLEQAIKLLEECANTASYPGRYRAMSMLGILHGQNLNWDALFHWLQKGSEQDPLGAVILSSCYQGIFFDQPIPSVYHNKALAIQLLEKYAYVKERDYPEVIIEANMMLSQHYAMGILVPVNLKKSSDYLLNACRLSYNCSNRELLFLTLLSCEVIIHFQKGDYVSARRALSIIDHDFLQAKDLSESIKLSFSQKIELLRSAIDQMEGASTQTSSDQAQSLGSSVSEAERYEQQEKFDLAIQAYLKAAKEGDALANYYAFFYYYPFPKDYLVGVTPDNFVGYLVLNSNKKNKEKALSYGRKSAVSGNFQAMYWLADILMQEGMYEEAVTWMCQYSDNAHYADQRMHNVYRMMLHLSQTAHVDFTPYLLPHVKKSGAANYVLSLLAREIQKDTDTCLQYAAMGASLGNYDAMYDYEAVLLQEKKFDQAENLARKMIEKNYPIGYVFLGEVQSDGHQDYPNAIRNFQKAIELKQPWGALDLGDLYFQGKGVEKNISKALEYAQLALELDPESGNFSIQYEIEEKIKEWKAALDSDPLPAVDSNESATVETLNLGLLNEIADVGLQVERRIELCEKAQNELFETADAQVCVLGSNGKTVVSTQKAEDFLLYLSTLPEKKQVIVSEQTKGTSGKLIRLIVQIY